jgi:uncharacterized integral membrane protein
MFRITKKKVAIFASLLAVLLLVLFLNIMKARNSVTGQVISETTGENTSFLGLFLMIAVLGGILTFVTIIYKRDHRY